MNATVIKRIAEKEKNRGSRVTRFGEDTNTSDASASYEICTTRLLLRKLYRISEFHVYIETT